MISFALAAMVTVAELPDKGIYPEHAQPLAPTIGAHGPVRVRIDTSKRLLTVVDGDGPLAVYAIQFVEAPKATTFGELHLDTYGKGMPPGAITASPAAIPELKKVTDASTPVEYGAPPPKLDRDRDGIVDQLDIALGAKKLLGNKATYIERYVRIPYPNGDVPRTEGVCTDTVIRALRNAGIDLQREVHEDIVQNPRAYPMVEKVDTSINHRRVKTLLPWFVRHFRTLPKGTPYRPGDVVFFDTFPTRPGPDHLGVVSDRAGASGLPLVINNWTDGAVDSEMDLLSFVPVTHHFRP